MISSFEKQLRRYIPECDEKRVESAYKLAQEVYRSARKCSSPAHKDRPFISCNSFRHAVRVAEALLPFYPRENVIIATLLHELPCLAPSEMIDVKACYGEDVYALLQGMERIYSIDTSISHMEQDGFRRLVVTLAKDIRVLLIRFFDRLLNLRSISLAEADIHKNRALEMLNVYVPIAARLGIYRLKVQLEDASFRILNPTRYQEIRQEIIEKMKRRQGSFHIFQQLLSEQLSKNLTIPVRVSGRIKSVYSAYTKLKKKNHTSIEDILDLFALRIIIPERTHADLDSVGYCYRALGIVHNKYTPVIHRFKDYIAQPKLNGYRSLHSTIIGIEGSDDKQPFEIQIRTESMHREAEYGIASHWWYDSSKVSRYVFSKSHIENLLQRYKRWYHLKQLAFSHDEIAQSIKTLQEGGMVLDERIVSHNHAVLQQYGISKAESDDYIFLERQEYKDSIHNEVEWLQRLNLVYEKLDRGPSDSGLPIDIFQDRVFVIGISDEIKELPHGSTPVDFAYALSSDIGHRCHLARVNNRVVSLDYKLQNGDRVDIITQNTATPNRYWLSFVTSHAARNAIKAWFEDFDKEGRIQAGKELLNRFLSQQGKAVLDSEYSLLSYYNGDYLSYIEREHLLELIGNGALAVDTVLEKAFSKLILPYARDRHTSDISKIRVVGERGLPMKLAACCLPTINDPIVGYVTRGQGVTIHLFSCLVLRHNAADGQRLVSAQWEDQEISKYRVEVTASDRIGLLRDICIVFAEAGINIEDTRLVRRDGNLVVREFFLHVPKIQALHQMLLDLKKVRDIQFVQQAKLSESLVS